MSAMFSRVPDRIRRLIRSFFRLFRRTIPNLLHRGGAVYLQRDYELPAARVREGLRSLEIPRRRRSFRAKGGLLRLFRIRRHLTGSRVAVTSRLEMGLEPRGAAGRLLLKAVPVWGYLTLLGFHEELLRNIAYPEFIDPGNFHPAGAGTGGYLYLLLKILCKFRLLPISELRLRTVFWMRVRAEPPIPSLPAETDRDSTLMTGELFFYSKRWSFLNFSAGRIAILLHPVTLFVKTRNRPLHGFLVFEWQRPFSRRTNRIGHRSGTWYLRLRGIGRYILRAGKYGGFQESFPFHPAGNPPWLFFLSRKGTRIEGFRLAGQFPINHLQQFHVLRSLPASPAKRTEAEAFCGESEPHSLPPIQRALGALYTSRLDLKAVDRLHIPLNDLLLRRPPLHAPPADTE